MPIPFEDHNTGPTGTAGYLKFLPRAAKEVWLGALFIMNVRGEPVEFTHARVRGPNPLLWRPSDLRTRCLESLTTSMFEACSVTPDLLLCLADEVGPELFTDSLRLDLSIGRIAQEGSAGKPSTEWIAEPGPGSEAAGLHKRLSDRGLLLEPFERAEAGLREVYAVLLR